MCVCECVRTCVCVHVLVCDVDEDMNTCYEYQ